MNHLTHSHPGAHYAVLGPAFQSRRIWLARDKASQKLVLLQRFDHPSPKLHHLLALKHECLPRVLDSWVTRGATYVVLERVEGPDSYPIGSAVLSADSQSRLGHLLASLRRLGWQACPKSLCLDSQGILRLRWLPRDGCESCQRVA